MFFVVLVIIGIAVAWKEDIMKSLEKSKIDLIFGFGFLLSFMGGCTAKYIYEANGYQPEWLNSVVVGLFMGLGFCSGSLMGITSIAIYHLRIDTFDKKIRAAFSLLIAILVFFFGIIVLWKVLGYFLELLATF